MKYPSHLTESLIKETIDLFKQIKRKDGMEAADLFKRISLTAAYGELYSDKISYKAFLDEVYQFISRNNFLEFWHLKQEAQVKQTFYVFRVSEKTIVNATIQELEQEIITQLKEHPFVISPTKKQIYNQILQTYDTTRNK